MKKQEWTEETRKAWQDAGIIFSNIPTSGSTYIMPDGSFINLQENFPKLGVDSMHGQLNTILLAHKFVSGPTKFTDRAFHLVNNAFDVISANTGVQATDFFPYFDLGMEEPTPQQYASLLNWLHYVMATVPWDKPLQIVFWEGLANIWGVTHKTYQFIAPENENGYLPEDIIKEIKLGYAKAREKKARK